MDSIKSSLLIVGLLLSYGITMSSGLSTISRRRYLQWQTGGCIATASTTALSNPSVAQAANLKSRTEGYDVQHTEREWAYILSGAQYNILRKGGTERQKSSILNTYTTENVGSYVCAGCNTPLFTSADKFSSGTGWPSFSTALQGVEEEELDPIRATLDGKEVRCATCGGHLGDLFNDGWIYRGTSAAKTGKRYCIDGAALIFKPEDGGEDVFGDLPPPNRVIKYEQSMYRGA
ncbi:peptide-methionine (R)-S-oxide reductase [Skeletonema marinoi]|uniref:Peptide-methionine (R)-S-oxide reductase n=1 Tax=Skeletonema marinoi TaxID=267567 RepID=A0AAD8Y2C0_9STRA|nr:peptide-methionine (R)-S-oxide reductase [Skeletonema marinoi]